VNSLPTTDLGYTITVLLFYMIFLSSAENQSVLKKGLSVI